ncbi:hypothetical protein OBBRIDRAFT_117500 [Obba rivulosa]|uniref:Uncharacterized protein n=1 Tax=Obba rivulosa TaxID=1052685 RepID=A0A8E2DIF2_9APHY|nr:hypothetical protein OBBRIDRAFT_117500 [Obba rivulosa]
MRGRLGMAEKAKRKETGIEPTSLLRQSERGPLSLIQWSVILSSRDEACQDELIFRWAGVQKRQHRSPPRLFTRRGIRRTSEHQSEARRQTKRDAEYLRRDSCPVEARSAPGRVY